MSDATGNEKILPRENFLHRLAAWLDRRSHGAPSARFAHRIYRLSLPNSLVHRRPSGPRFFIAPPDVQTGKRDIFWDHRLVGNTRPLAELRNSARGHCFLVASGPSLKDVDLRLLKGHPTFGVNGSIAKFTDASLAPTYHLIHDDDFFEHRFPLVRDVIKSGSKCFFSCAGLSRICEFEPRLLSQTDFYAVEPINHFYNTPRLSLEEFQTRAKTDPDIILPKKLPEHDCRLGFSRNLDKGFFLSRTVLFGALQLAYHIGYRRIFILGMDLDYRGPNPRFYESSAQMRPSRIDRDYEPYILPAFEVVKDMCAKEKLEVYNLSPTSRLPASIIPPLTLPEAMATIH